MLLIGLLGLFAPRIILILLWFIYQPFIVSAFGGMLIWPLLGLILLPTTTLAYCLAISMGHGISSFSGLFILLLGILFDAGAIGSGHGALRK